MFPGWTTGGVNSDWCWGAATSGPVGELVYGTNLEGDYASSACSYIESPAVPAGLFVAEPSLTFTHWRDMEYSTFSNAAWDAGAVMISADGGDTWEYLVMPDYDMTAFSTVQSCFGIGSGDGVYSGTHGFTTSSVDLWDYADQGDVKIRFAFASDSVINWEGWYLKDVTLGGVPLLP
jgi:hypothetical protein